VGVIIASVLFSGMTVSSCFICSVNKRRYLLKPELTCYNWCQGVGWVDMETKQTVIIKQLQ